MKSMMIGDMKWQRLSAKVVPDLRPEIVEAFLADDPELQKDYSVNDGCSMPLKLTDIKASVHAEGKNVVELI